MEGNVQSILFAMIPSYNNYNYPYSISDTPTCKSFQKDNARYGRTGLSNLGNTCYMNTAIQVGISFHGHL